MLLCPNSFSKDWTGKCEMVEAVKWLLVCPLCNFLYCWIEKGIGLAI